MNPTTRYLRTAIAAALTAAASKAAPAMAAGASQAAPPPPSGGAPVPTPDFTGGVNPNRVLTVDAVLLKQGTATPGTPDRYIDWEGNRYLFASEENKRTFANAPASFAARDGGACGRMGPLGGIGDARLHHVQDGLLYFFASEACMSRFKAEPRRYMEAYDLMPKGTPEQQLAGIAAIDRWVAWAGGREAVEAAARYSQRTVRRVESGGAQWDVSDVIEVDGPQTMRRTKTWSKVGGEAKDTLVTRIETTPATATISGNGGPALPLTPTRREAFVRSVNRLPYCILRARFRPEAGFLAIQTSEGRLGDHDCDFVQTWFEGNRTALAIDKRSGELVQIGYIGREESADAAVMSLYRDVLAAGSPQVLRLPTRCAIYPEGAKEATVEPEASILIERAAQASPASPEPVQAPSK
jgi:YHS domain-containing protein